MRSPTARDAAEGLADQIERRMKAASLLGGAQLREAMMDLGRLVYVGSTPIITALRSAGAEGGETQKAVEMREACMRLCNSARYGAPSTWPGAFPRGWKSPGSWDPDRVPTPEEAALHDNGVTDAWIAILTGTRDEQGNPRVPRTTDGGESQDGLR